MTESRINRHTISFKHAFTGLFHTLKTQPNLRIHVTIAAIVIVSGIFFHLSHLEWIIIAFTIAWVIVSEMINTSIEAIVDLITHERRIEAKIAKDVAAGMVLVGAMTSIIVGLIIFTPYLISYIK
jgi:diacylglycerol kinase